MATAKHKAKPVQEVKSEPVVPDFKELVSSPRGTTPKRNEWTSGVNLASQDYLDLIEFHKYHGFDREEFASMLKQAGIDYKTALEIGVMAVMRGGKYTMDAKLRDGRKVISLGIKKAGKEGLTIFRIVATIPDVISYALLLGKIPKKISCSCPAQYQFPAAACFPMEDEVRKQHIEFCKLFSAQIGGEFNAQLYETVAKNTLRTSFTDYLIPSSK
jgi:hypothetical protein